MKQYIMVISINSLMSQDLNRLRELNNFKYIVSQGSIVKRVVNDYSNLINPTNTSIITGENPYKHRILLDKFGINTKKIREKEYEDIKCNTILDLFKDNGDKVSVLSWPITEYSSFIRNFTYIKDTSFKGIFKSILKGNSLYMLKNVIKYSNILKVNTQPEYDNFTAILAMELLEKKLSNIIFMNFNQLDYTRKRYSVNSDNVGEALNDIDNRVGDIIKWCKNKNILENTTFFVVSNGGMYDCRNVININNVLVKEKFIKLNSKGKMIDYLAYAHCEGGSSFIYLKNPEDMNFYGKVKIFLENLVKDNYNFIRKVEETSNYLDRCDLDLFSFRLEANPGCIFEEKISTFKFIEDIDLTSVSVTLNKSKAFYGYSSGLENSDALFLAYGNNVKQGFEIEECNILDIAPTIAMFNDLQFNTSKGKSLIEMRR